MRAALLCLACACGGVYHQGEQDAPEPLAPPGIPAQGCTLYDVHYADVLDAHPIKRFPGLVGSLNPNRPPEGSSEIDQETLRRSIDVIESRRGFSRLLVGNFAPTDAMAFYQEVPIWLNYPIPGGSNGQIFIRGGFPNGPMVVGLPNSYPLPIDHPVGGGGTPFASAQKAAYLQSIYGQYKIERAQSTGFTPDGLQPIFAPSVHPPNWTQQGTSLYGTSVTTVAGSWLANGFQAAYRFTLCRLGANKELIESEPSERVIVSNTSGGARHTQITFQNSWMMLGDTFVRAYRSKQVANGTDPDDEMFLTREFLPSGSLDANGYFPVTATTVFTDPTLDTSLFVPLYTNPKSGLGLGQANNSAPAAADMVWFKNRMHFLNTVDVQRLIVRVIGTGSGGISDGDTFTVGGAKFTFRTAPITPITDVQLATAGTVAQNLENTARALAASINAYFGSVVSVPLQSVVLARYISITATDAGQVLLQSIVPNAPSFTAQTSSSLGWDRNYTAATASDPNAQVSGWTWSAVGQPESVPTANSNPIGDPTAVGYRWMALKETLFAFKQDGLWQITDDGTVAGPTLRLVDPTIKLIAPDTVAAVDNKIYALCDQGVVEISETGAVTNVSHLQIERDLFKLIGYVGATTLASVSFGVAHLPDHTYILALPESPTATSATLEYVYNVQSQAWTRWGIGNLRSAALNPITNQLFLGPDGTGGFYVERRDFAASDYQDLPFNIASPTATATASLVFAGDLRPTGDLRAQSFAVGDIVQQFQSVKALQQRVIGVSYSSSANQTTVTLDSAPKTAWNQIVNLTIVKAIQAQVKFLPFTADRPITDKDWGDAYLSFRYNDLDAMSVGWASEKVPITETAVEPISSAQSNSRGDHGPLALEAWGAKAWGSAIWGRQAKDVVLKCTIPQDFGYSSQLTLSLSMPCALQRFELSAIDIKIAGMTDKVVR